MSVRLKLAGALLGVVTVGCAGARPRPEAPPDKTEEVAVSADTEWGQDTLQCDTGDPYACYRAAMAYEEGAGPKRDLQRARVLYGKACSLGEPNACALEVSLAISEAPKSDEARAGRKTLQQGCFEGDVELACLVLGSWESDQTWEPGKAAQDAALKAWTHACDKLESVDGCFMLGTGLREWREDEDEGRAYEAFRQACAFEHLPACRRAADALACGQGVAQDEAGAVRQYLAACRLGDEPSCSQAASFFAVLPDDTRDSLNVNLGPTLRYLAVRSAAAGLDEDAALLASKLPEDEAAFVRAGLALDAGKWDDARAHLETLKRARPQAPEVEIFEALVSAAQAQQPLFEALVDAWLKAGAPDLRKGGLVEPPMPFWETDCWDHARPWMAPDVVVGLPALWALSLGHDGAPEEILEAAAKVASDAQVADRLGALAALAHPESVKKLSPSQAEAKARLARSFAEEGKTFGTFVWLGTGEEKTPFTEEERQALLSAKGWAPPKDALRNAISEQASRLPEEERTHFGAAATLQALVGLVQVADAHRVAARAKASAADPALSPKVRRKLGEKLLALGEAQLRAGWFLERLGGTALVDAGAELTGAEKDAQKRERRQRELAELLGGGDYLPEVGTWPSWRLREDLTRAAGDDEVGFKRRLDERVGER